MSSSTVQHAGKKIISFYFLNILYFLCSESCLYIKVPTINWYGKRTPASSKMADLARVITIECMSNERLLVNGTIPPLRIIRGIMCGVRNGNPMLSLLPLDRVRHRFGWVIPFESLSSSLPRSYCANVVPNAIPFVLPLN